MKNKLTGIIFFSKKIKENDLYIKILSSKDSVEAGIVYGGNSSKKKLIYQNGYFVDYLIKKKNYNSPNIIDAEISKIRLTVTPEEVREVNSLSLMENTVTKSEFLSAVLTVPFMANKRVVIVSNLISKLNSKKVLDDSEWSDIVEQLKLVPDSTDLIFREYDFDKRNYLFKKISNLCDIRHFPLLRPNELKQWVTDKVNNMGMTIDLKAVNLIVDFIGSDLRAIDSELNELYLYSDEGLITESDVQVTVAYVKDQSIFR